MSKFKEGDIVRLKTDCSGINAGEKCVLKYGTHSKSSMKELFAHSQYYECSCNDNWELVSTKSKFKVGDRVKAISESHGWAGVKPGDIGTILRIDEDGQISVNFEAMYDWGCNEDNLELIDNHQLYRHIGIDYGVAEWKTTYTSGKIPFKYPLSLSDYYGARISKYLTEFNRKENFMQKLTKALKKLFSPDQAKMFEAGLIQEDGSLTRSGVEAVIDFVSEQADCKAFLLKEAESIIKENEKESD